MQLVMRAQKRVTKITVAASKLQLTVLTPKGIIIKESESENFVHWGQIKIQYV